MSAEIQFFVPGVPAPGGSKRAFRNKHTGRVVVVDDCRRNKDWRATVGICASEAIHDPLSGPVGVEVVFFMPRPKGHFGKRGLRPAAPTYPTTRPDATKLWRAAEDALKGIAWSDDSQVVLQTVIKAYSEKPGLWVRIWAVNGKG